MNFIFLFFLIIIKEIKGKSEEYYNCINPEKTVNSYSDCASIVIPNSDGYKCCSMKISYNDTTTYNCLPLQDINIESKEALDAYFSKRSLKYFLSTSGGTMEINCGGNIKIIKIYEKLSDEYQNCYNGHIKGVKNENDCIGNDIPLEEKGKCCSITTTKKINNQTIDDKRCYIIKDEYFNNKNLSDYLLNELNVPTLNQIKDTNYFINCKNKDIFTYKSLPEDIEPKKEKDNIPTSSGLELWKIALIVIFSLLVLIVSIIVIIFIKKNLNKKQNEKATTTSQQSEKVETRKAEEETISNDMELSPKNTDIHKPEEKTIDIESAPIPVDTNKSKQKTITKDKYETKLPETNKSLV